MIRPAVPEDAPVIAALGERFHAEAGWGDIVEYVASDCEATVRHLIGSPEGIVLVADEGGIVGMAGAMIYPMYFNLAHRTGQELFWWSKPGSRGRGIRLLDALETAARDAGCASFAMLALDKIDPERMAELYRRRGYRASEHIFIRRL